MVSIKVYSLKNLKINKYIEKLTKLNWKAFILRLSVIPMIIEAIVYTAWVVNDSGYYFLVDRPITGLVWYITVIPLTGAVIGFVHYALFVILLILTILILKWIIKGLWSCYLSLNVLRT